jgi:hypothetical protein
MLLRTLVLLALPASGLVAQLAPLRIVITAPNNAGFRVSHSSNGPNDHFAIGRGRWEITTDSGAIGTLAVVAADSMTRIHVEASERNRVIATGDGSFVAIRRDTAFVSVDARSRAPSSFSFPRGDLWKPRHVATRLARASRASQHRGRESGSIAGLDAY